MNKNPRFFFRDTSRTSRPPHLRKYRPKTAAFAARKPGSRSGCFPGVPGFAGTDGQQNAGYGAPAIPFFFSGVLKLDRYYIFI